MSPRPARPRLLAAAGALLALSVSSPWATAVRAPRLSHPATARAVILGASQPMRLLGLAAVVVLYWAIRRGARRAGWAAIALAALALPVGLDPGRPGVGRVYYVAAMILAAIGAGLVRSRAEAGEPASA